MKLIEDIIYNNNVESILSQAINHIYTNGPFPLQIWKCYLIFPSISPTCLVNI